MEIWVQEVHWEVLWGSLPVGRGKNQDQAEGEIGLQCCPNGVLSHPIVNSRAGWSFRGILHWGKKVGFGTHRSPPASHCGESGGSWVSQFSVAEWDCLGRVQLWAEGMSTWFWREIRVAHHGIHYRHLFIFGFSAFIKYKMNILVMTVACGRRQQSLPG